MPRKHQAGPPFTARLDPEAAAALDALCAGWRVGKAEAVRRALREAAERDAALRPVLEALARIESRLAGSPAASAAADLPTDPDAGTRAAAAATSQALAAWAMADEVPGTPKGGG